MFVSLHAIEKQAWTRKFFLEDLCGSGDQLQNYSVIINSNYALLIHTMPNRCFSIGVAAQPEISNFEDIIDLYLHKF